jgi:hypothetical protein
LEISELQCGNDFAARRLVKWTSRSARYDRNFFVGETSSNDDGFPRKIQTSWVVEILLLAESKSVSRFSEFEQEIQTKTTWIAT